MCVHCIALCTTVAHNTTQNRPDNLPPIITALMICLFERRGRREMQQLTVSMMTQLLLTLLLAAAAGHDHHHDDISQYQVMLSSRQIHWKSSPGSFDECRLSARWPPTLTPRKQTTCESASRLLPSTSTIAIYYYHSAQKLILILPFHWGWKAEST